MSAASLVNSGAEGYQSLQSSPVEGNLGERRVTPLEAAQNERTEKINKRGILCIALGTLACLAGIAAATMLALTPIGAGIFLGLVGIAAIRVLYTLVKNECAISVADQQIDAITAPKYQQLTRLRNLLNKDEKRLEIVRAHYEAGPNPQMLNEIEARYVQAIAKAKADILALEIELQGMPVPVERPNNNFGGGREIGELGFGCCCFLAGLIG